jgi:Xaa-Pro aminopeptidase
MSELPFPQTEYEERWLNARAECRRRGLEALVVFSRGGAVADSYADVLYLTNHYHPFVWSNDFPGHWIGRSHAGLVLPLDAEPTLVVDVTDWRRDQVVVDDVRFDFDVPGTVARVLAERGLERSRVGLVGGNAMLVSPYRHLMGCTPSVQWVEVDDLVERLRMFKSPREQQYVRDAVAIGNQVMQAMMETALVRGKTEAECIAAGLDIAHRAGINVYDAACSSGPHSYHYAWGRLPSWTSRALEPGDFFHVDTYGALEGYLYDFSRTAICGGEAAASGAQLELVRAATDAVDAGVAAMRPGVPAKEVFHAVRRVLEERDTVGDGLNGEISTTPALTGSFPAHGHQIGLFWDPPWLLPDEETPLDEGMCFGVELMAGKPGVGAVKCEQDVIVTGNGCEVLTTIPKAFY